MRVIPESTCLFSIESIKKKRWELHWRKNATDFFNKYLHLIKGYLCSFDGKQFLDFLRENTEIWLLLESIELSF